MPYCNQCGAKIPSNAKFCNECGAKILVDNINNTQDSYLDRETYHRLPGRIVFWLDLLGRTPNRSIEILIDDNKVGEIITSGKPFNVDVEDGVHEVELRFSGNYLFVGRISITEDEPEFAVHFFVNEFGDLEMRSGEYVSKKAQSANSTRSAIVVEDKQSRLSSTPVNYPVRTPINTPPTGRRCPRCGGFMSVQTVAESRKSGCLTVLLYVLLALTVFGLLIVIPLALRKKTVTRTYGVCQNCGFNQLISSQ